MDAIASAELIDEFDVALKDGSAEWRVRTLRRLADLLLSSIERLSPTEIGLFDDLLVRLLDCVGVHALSELSAVIAGVAGAPGKTVRRLARHQDPAVAGPLLAKSAILIDADLVEIARNRSQQHLAAVAERPNLNESLTDLIIRMAGKDAARVLVRNPTARFSKSGLTVLLAAAVRDETLAESLGLRPDLPVAALQGLLSKTSERVRARLLKAAPAEVKKKIQAELEGIAAKANPQPARPNEGCDAHAAVAALSRTGKLNDSTVNRFAIRREYANVIAALSLLSGASVETIAPLLNEMGGEGLLIACRASRLNWQTTQAILNNREVEPLSTEQLEHARQVFEMFLVSTAQYTIRFEFSPEPEAGSGANTAIAAGGRA